MQETIEKRKEKLKHKIAIKPVFKSKSKEGIEGWKEISVEIKTEKSERQQKVKAGFVPPAIIRHEVESEKTNLPLFGHKQDTKISASEEKMKSTAMEITVKREVKERLKGSVEELLSEPQKLKALSGEIEEPRETLVETNFDSSIPLIGRKIGKPFEVPEIKLINFIPSIPKKGFDTSIPKIESEECERVVTIPKISVTKLPEVIMRSHFDEEVSSQVISKINMVVEVETEEEEIATAVGALEEKETLGASGEKAEREDLELPNFLEFLLGKGVGRISEGKPVCIVVPQTRDEYEKLIAILCRDIYREKIGGMPMPISRDTIEDLMHELESLTERRIIVIKKIEKVSKELLRILEQFYAQDMGFLILVSSNPTWLKEEIERRGEISPNIITVNPQPEIENYMDKILSVIRGRDWLTQVERFKEKNVSLGEEFKTAIEGLDSELIKKYLNPKRAPEQLRYDWDKLVASSPDGDEDASPVHSAMKAFVWTYEWKKHGKKIIPELEASRGEDVKVEEEGKNYEIETLFGKQDVRGHLTRKVKKYNKGEEIYFVLRNLDILRNLSLFSSFRGDWRRAGYKVQLFGLDLGNEELVPLEEYELNEKSIDYREKRISKRR